MNKVPLREKLGYGVGAIGLDLSYGMFYSYLSLYLTNGLGIKPLFLLILAPLARLWDGVNDPMMGMIVDKTNTKMGKYRPWILTGALLNAIVLCLLFNNPGFALNSVGLYIYVAVLYVFWGMTNTLADIPFWSMIPSFASEEKDRNLVSTIARTFSGLGQGIIRYIHRIRSRFLRRRNRQQARQNGLRLPDRRLRQVVYGDGCGSRILCVNLRSLD